MMKEKTHDIPFWTFVFVISFASMLLICYATERQGYRQGEKAMQKRAIKAGVAEWVPDENGAAKFRFILEDVKSNEQD